MRSKAGAACILLLLFIGCGSREPKSQTRRVEPVRVPESFRVRFETSKGAFIVEVTRAWAPRGADRFHELIRERFYDNARFFRVVPNFVVQFGLSGSPKVSQLWSQAFIPDDPVVESNRAGTITYAKRGPATRTTQVFINLMDNQRLDSMGFAPFGRVMEGMDVVSNLYKGYGDAPPGGIGPVQDRILLEGNDYLERQFPRLDYIKTARIVE